MGFMVLRILRETGDNKFPFSLNGYRAKQG